MMNEASMRLPSLNHSETKPGAKASKAEVCTQNAATAMTRYPAAARLTPKASRALSSKSADPIAATTIRHAKAGNTNRYSLCGIREWLAIMASDTAIHSIDLRLRTTISVSRIGSANAQSRTRRSKYQPAGLIPNADAFPWIKLIRTLSI